MEFIKLQNVCRTYNQGKAAAVSALRNINLHIERGEMVAIVGPSGSGKSTLLNILGLMDYMDSGQYYVEGHGALEKINEKKRAELRNMLFGFVVQDFALIEQYTVAQNIAVPLNYRKKKLSASKQKEKIKSLLQQLNIADKYSVPVHDLSGGQRQRVAIARALINEPDVILADEPTGELDSTTSREIMEVFKSINKMGTTVIMVTHNDEIAVMCHRILQMQDGQLEELSV